LHYLNQFKKGSLIGAVAEPIPAKELVESPNPPNLEPAMPAQAGRSSG
jgi:hypothetical protein